MEYLQYDKVQPAEFQSEEVLNLIITGIPSIHSM